MGRAEWIEVGAKGVNDVWTAGRKGIGLSGGEGD